jgi:hypothetical protein
LQEFKESTPLDKEADARVTLAKVKDFVKASKMDSYSIEELKLIGKLAQAIARKKELPPLIEALDKEQKAVKLAWFEVRSKSGLEKVMKKANKSAGLQSIIYNKSQFSCIL